MPLAVLHVGWRGLYAALLTHGGVADAETLQAKPTARVPVQLQAVSYLGSSVANASMSVRWHTPKAQGVVVSGSVLHSPHVLQV